MLSPRLLALWASPLLLLTASALTASPASVAVHGDPSKPQARSIQELRDEIAKNLNKTPKGVFEELGKHGNRAAFTALRDAIKQVKGRPPKIHAFRAMRHLLVDEALREEVLDYITAVVLKGVPGDARAAVRTLASYGEPGRKLLRRTIAEARDVQTRQFAFRPIHAELLREASAEVRDLVLESFVVPESGSEQAALALLGIYKSSDDLERYIEVVEDDKRPVSMRRLVLRAMESHLPAANESSRKRKADLAEKVLLSGISSEEPRLVHQGLNSARLRPAPISAATLKITKKLAKSKDEATRHAATLLRLAKGERKLNPLKLARSKDRVLRRAAATALAGTRDDASFEALSKLAVDKEWRVRAEAVRGLLAQRDRRAIAFLLDRLDAENGRLTADIATALEGLTGRP